MKTWEDVRAYTKKVGNTLDKDWKNSICTVVVKVYDIDKQLLAFK